MSTVATTCQKTGRIVGGISSALGAFGQTAGGAFGKVASSIGGVVGAMATLGPIGGIVSGISAGIKLFTASTIRAAKAAEELAKTSLARGLEKLNAIRERVIDGMNRCLAEITANAERSAKAFDTLANAYLRVSAAKDATAKAGGDTALANLRADKQAAAGNADGAVTSRAQVVSDIMRAAREAGIATGRGGLTDPGSAAWAAVIVDTNAAMAAGYARAEIANAYGARLAFPAQELVRIEPRRFPRNWPAIWQARGGTLHRGRMVALKGDPVWLRISRFGHPYPPFDFNSGMGVEDVPYGEAVELGLIADGYRPPEKSPLAAFNDGLQAEVAFRNDETWQALRRAFGDQIRQKDGKIAWRNDLIREAFTSKKPFAIRLGEASGALLDKLPASIPAQAIAGKQLTVTQDWLDKKRKDGTDHRAHFHPLESDPRNIPLTVEDLERIPSIWREPDAVSGNTSSRGRILLEQKALDGGVYKMVVDIEDSPRLVTLFKNKAPAESLP